MARCKGTVTTEHKTNFGEPCGLPAVRGSEYCNRHGGLEDTKTPEAVRREKPGLRCTRIKQDGEQCKAYAIKGATVCRAHGGSTPQVRKKARERLMEMVDPAVVQLNRIIEKADTSDADRLKAIAMVLDRTGYGAKATLEVEEKTPGYLALERVLVERYEGGQPLFNKKRRRKEIEAPASDDDDVVDAEVVEDVPPQVTEVEPVHVPDNVVHFPSDPVRNRE
ncbi:hypothetical protein [Agromyces sp. GXS1127]|uniref:hypothetical protein n=1 Tax=Agromyces sp. GXS1127 TaxID=3424181 RepID=UPI003D31E08D